MNPLLVIILIASVSEVFSEKKVLVLSFDGFRSDYYHPDKTRQLWALRNISAAPKYMESIFPTKTMATLHTVSTGVYPDKHGVYNNEMFDFTDGVNKYDDYRFSDLNRTIVPIWIENQDKGGISGLMMWPGGEWKYNGKQANFHQKYEVIEWEKRAATILDWINVKHCNLVMAYFEDYSFYKEPRLDDHVKSHITKVDNIIETIRKGIPDDFDVIIMSDHGTSEVPGTNVIDINSLVPERDVRKIVSGPLVFVKVPLSSYRDSIYYRLYDQEKSLHSFKVYDKRHFKDHWYIKNVDALSDVLLLVAEPKHTFMEKSVFENLLHSQNLTEQTFVTLENGYDNREADMRALFVGIGPSFKDDKFSENFIQLIDVYPCLKALLLLKGNASTDQDKNDLNSVLRELLVDRVVVAYES